MSKWTLGDKILCSFMQKVFVEHLPRHVTRLDSGNTWREETSLVPPPGSLSCGDAAPFTGKRTGMSHCFAATQRAEEVSASAQILTAFGKRRLKTAVCQPRAKPERPPARLAAGPSGALPLQRLQRGQAENWCPPGWGTPLSSLLSQIVPFRGHT